jgi:cytochrome c-type biogenesis protein CcmE|uniref:Cytochrome c maturation protein CcmE n=1 Tax=Thermoanaerobaculum aquaticum TaxID=1312852 RepID=A0A7V1ZI43_9BACT
MNRRAVWTVVGLALIVGFVAFGAGAFKASLTPYVSFAQARASQDAVQVAGKLVQGSSYYDEANGKLVFVLEDTQGDRMKVEFAGTKPGNFEEATQIVAIGRFTNGVFAAEKLLVKCPSKYQGVEEKQYGARS